MSSIIKSLAISTIQSSSVFICVRQRVQAFTRVPLYGRLDLREREKDRELMLCQTKSCIRWKTLRNCSAFIRRLSESGLRAENCEQSSWEGLRVIESLSLPMSGFFVNGKKRGEMKRDRCTCLIALP